MTNPVVLLPLLLQAAAPVVQPAPVPVAPSASAQAAAAPGDPLPEDWVTIPDDEILVMTLAKGGMVAIRLAVPYAPIHIGNVRKLALAHWWDGTSIYRAQDNYVAQWGDASGKKPLPPGLVATPPAEYDRPGASAVARLGRRDPYADWAGYSRDGWPMAGNFQSEWLTHCYGMVGVGRDMAPDTGNGAELYAAIGHGPRALDRNVALIGRVVDGVEHLSTLPRGTGDLGFYATEAERTPIASIRLASDMPEAARPRYQYRKPDSPRFAAWIAGRENRQPPFFMVPAGGADICNAMPPVRRLPMGG